MGGPDTLREGKTLTRQLFFYAVIAGLSLLSTEGLRKVLAPRSTDAVSAKGLKLSDVTWDVQGTTVWIALHGRQYVVSPDLPARLRVTNVAVEETGITISCETLDLTGNIVTGKIFIPIAEVREALDPLIAAPRREHSSMLDYEVAVDPCGNCARDFMAQTTLGLVPNPMKITLKPIQQILANDLAQVRNP